MKRTVLVLIILTFVSKISGFLREVFMAWRFGATIQTDTYIAAITIPVLIINFVTIGLSNSLIPVLSSAERKGEREKFFNKLLTVGTVVALAITLIIIVLAKPLNQIVVRGFSSEEIKSVIFYTRLLAVTSLFQILSFAFMGYLQQNNRFYIAATASIPQNFGTIVGAILSPNPNSIIVMVIGTIIGYFLQLVWVFFPFIQSKFKFKFDFDLKDEHFKMMAVLIIPIIVTLSASQINGIISRSIASGLEEGSISILNYSQKVTGLFYNTLVVTLSTVLFTRQAKLSSEKDWKGIFQVTRDNLSSVMMLIIPIMLGMMFLSKEVMQLIFQRGAFTAEDSVRSGLTLLFYSPTLIALSATEILSKMFFSMQQAKKPMYATLINIALNIVLNFLVYKIYGIYGLAAAGSVAALVGVLVLVFMARKMFHAEGVHFWSVSYLKYAIAGVVMVVALLALRTIPMVSQAGVITYTVLCGLVGAIVYLTTLYIFKTKEMIMTLDLVRNKLRRS